MTTMIRLKSIAEGLYDVCLVADKNITGLPEADARLWAKTNALRHARTVRAIVDHAHKTGKNSLQILNASGMSCGHQDFSIVSFLKQKTDIEVGWTAYESPRSPYLNNDVFKRYVEDLKIELRLSDFSRQGDPYVEAGQKYDVILFTEIAEHLDYSVLLKSFIAMRQRLKEEGIVIITTPNLLRLANRIRFILGNADGPYWGDGVEDLSKGLYGHIANYDIRRFRRLLADVGYTVDRAYTFNCGWGSREKYPGLYIPFRFIDFLSLFFKYGRALLFIVAGKDDSKNIPFRI